MLVHSSSVTAARPHLRSTNCCCSFGRSARCLASSASSRAFLYYASVNTLSRVTRAHSHTFELSASRPCSYQPARRSCPPPHRPLRKWFQRRVRIRCPGLGTGPGPLRVLRLFVLVLLCGTDRFVAGARRRKERTRSSRQNSRLEQDRYQNGS